jgi:hypothetical protein
MSVLRRLTGGWLALGALFAVLIASTTVLGLTYLRGGRSPIPLLYAVYFTVEVTTVGYGASPSAASRRCWSARRSA